MKTSPVYSLNSQQNKRVLEVNVDDQSYGGVFAFVMNLIRNNKDESLVMDICAFEPFEDINHVEEIQSHNGVVHECVDEGNFVFKQFNTCKKYYGLLKKEKYKIVHVHSDVSYKLLLYGVTAKLAGVPHIIVHSHSAGVEGNHKILKKLLQSITRPVLARMGFSKVACSRLAAQWMFGNKADQAVIVNNGIQLSKFRYDKSKYQSVRQELGIQDELLIGTVARFSFPKYPEKLLATFHEILKKKPDCKLLWIGAGPLMDEIVQKAHELGISDAIIFYGTSDRVADLYQAMDCFVMTSRFEGLCIAAVEAQAAGIPCVCSDVLPQEVVLSEEYHAFPLAKRNTDWADMVLETAKDPRRDTYRELKQKEYDISDTVKRICEMYKN